MRPLVSRGRHIQAEKRLIIVLSVVVLEIALVIDWNTEARAAKAVKAGERKRGREGTKIARSMA
jgi:hypothetical protein